MNQTADNTNSLELRKKATISIQKAKSLILETIPNNEIVSIYLKGSYVQNELKHDSDVDIIVILKSEEYLTAVYQLTKQYGNIG